MKKKILSQLGMLPLIAGTFTNTLTPAPAIPAVEEIVTRMSEAQAKSSARRQAYEVSRLYQLFGSEPERTKSDVTADVAYGTSGLQHFTITRHNGEYMGERIVRKILQNESEVLAAPRRSEISPQNYEFQFSREDILRGRHCYVLELRPRHRTTQLIEGSAWLDANTFLIHRIEGKPAKAPSWFVRDIHIILDFREVDGMWLQTDLTSTAKVRFLGPHTLASHDVQYRIGAHDIWIKPLTN